MAPPSDRERTGRVSVLDGSLKADRAYEVIRQDIVACRIHPGATFSESELMARYDIGKATVRVALQRLAHTGLVTPIPRQGYRVAPVTLRDVEEVFALRIVLEPYAARCAAGKVNRGQLERLERNCRVRSSDDIGNQIDFFLEANRSFHMAIAVASGNQRLVNTLSGLLDEMTRLVALGFGVQGVRPNIENDHTLLIEYLSAGDADNAEIIARRHVETFREMTIAKVMASLAELPEIATANIAPLAGRSGS
ncbi:GntR family transcriptional regulator [Acuticoccus sediminis]|uniref:GntR family transcriptional regulator n=1 Tax=Acuticoccus sediminis TaxID=2184697 RepID=A0A8B2NLV5_9HYPH|nr:GntR family transcriptional regulator [Acuticoccus sediminis]RAH97435.1 GntR family transcriptional regulator [Acuticoccus sediminis]